MDQVERDEDDVAEMVAGFAHTDELLRGTYHGKTSIREARCCEPGDSESRLRWMFGRWQWTIKSGRTRLIFKTV